MQIKSILGTSAAFLTHKALRVEGGQQVRAGRGRGRCTKNI